MTVKNAQAHGQRKDSRPRQGSENGPGLPISPSMGGLKATVNPSSTMSSLTQKNFFQRESRDSSNAAPRGDSRGPSTGYGSGSQPRESYNRVTQSYNSTPPNVPPAMEADKMLARRSQQNFFNSTQGSGRMPSLGTSSSGGGILPASGATDLNKQFAATTQGGFLANTNAVNPSVGLGNIPNEAAQFIGQTSLDVKTLFKQNEPQVTTQIKIDPVTGLNQRI